MNKLYIFNYTSDAGTRESVKEWIAQEKRIYNWRYDMPGCFYLVSEAHSTELSESFSKFSGGRGRHLIAELNENRQGLLPRDTWAFMSRVKGEMDKLSPAELLYKDEYIETKNFVSDDPVIIFSENNILNKNEKYEILHFLNSLDGDAGDPLSKRTRRVCEWMIHEHLPKDIQSTRKVRTWLYQEYPRLSKEYPFEN